MRGGKASVPYFTALHIPNGTIRHQAPRWDNLMGPGFELLARQGPRLDFSERHLLGTMRLRVD